MKIQQTYFGVSQVGKARNESNDLLAAILAKGIGLQLKQGLYREYINRQEELPVMRGKINMPGTIKNRLAHERVLTCDFDELSENNLLNQILKNGQYCAYYRCEILQSHNANTVCS